MTEPPDHDEGEMDQDATVVTSLYDQMDQALKAAAARMDATCAKADQLRSKLVRNGLRDSVANIRQAVQSIPPARMAEIQRRSRRPAT